MSAQWSEKHGVEIQSMCVMSTGHIAPNERDRLDGCLHAREYPSAGGPYGDVGWFFWVPTDPDAIDAEDREGWPTLHAALDWCRARGFTYVLIDRDAESVDGLAYHDHELETEG